ncbi:hypothetical protein BD410DRAFT_828046 [Rickenella mellea]|uniref:Uncharacterized protein n=1 Tax=Rickenella mellea TaxID=50990 RepID=A0A4Y7Q6M8_9AGAM|nr:hypothetical protein BD410DRAFT_828046 [Rickenella mellea]
MDKQASAKQPVATRTGETTSTGKRVYINTDQFSENDHVHMDRLILRENPGPETPRPSHLLIDLSRAIRQLRKDLNPSDPSQLLDDNPWLADELTAAWKRKNFKSIRKLAILWPSLPTENEPSGSLTTGVYEVDATRKAWECEFKGESHKLLHRAISEMNLQRTGKTYANFVPIVQSSGMGKSRAVDELGKLVFSVPFNLRNTDNGFPLPDVNVLPFFKVRPDETYDALRDRFLCFFGVLFDDVGKKVPNLTSPGPSISSEEIAQKWHGFMNTAGNRKTLYKEVVDESDKQWMELGKLDSTKRSKKAIEKAEKAGLSLLQLLQRISTPFPENLQKYTKSAKKRGDVLLVLSFDETHVMVDDRLTDDIRTGYHALCGALSELYQLDIFSVFLSTNSSLSKYSPKKSAHWSLRVRDGPLDPIQVPFVELGFDQWKERFIAEEGQHTLEDVCEVSFMVRFGRFLWWTRWENGNTVVRNDMINFAIAKLQGGSSEAGTDAKMAALSIRLLLEFEPTRLEAAELQNRMVAGHMRVAYAIPKHRDYMRSGAPSEPILAEAAARILQGEPLYKHIRGFMHNGLISKGERGELVARILLTSAHDAALDAMGPVGNEKVFSRPIPVVTFLKALFADQYIELILNCRPDNDPNGPTLQEAFKYSYFNFTHFGKAYDEGCTSDMMACWCLHRGLALVGHNDQKDLDLLLAILHDISQPISQRNSTVAVLQIKDSLTIKGSSKVDIDAKELGFFQGDGPSRPYLNISMQLGARSRYEKNLPIRRSAKNFEKAAKEGFPANWKPETQVGQPSTPAKVTVGGGRTSKGTRSEPARVNDKHPRYTIRAVGCSPNVYKVVGEKSVFSELLASGGLLEEHGRQERPFLEKVLGLKPFWTSTPLSLHWGKRIVENEAGDNFELRGVADEEDCIYVGLPKEDDN